jgi:hypothetical protein
MARISNLNIKVMKLVDSIHPEITEFMKKFDMTFSELLYPARKLLQQSIFNQMKRKVTE